MNGLDANKKQQQPTTRWKKQFSIYISRRGRIVKKLPNGIKKVPHVTANNTLEYIHVFLDAIYEKQFLRSSQR